MSQITNDLREESSEGSLQSPRRQDEDETEMVKIEMKFDNFQGDDHNIVSDEEHTASKEIETGQKRIQTFDYNESLPGGHLTTQEALEADNHAGKLAAAVDDERGME